LHIIVTEVNKVFYKINTQSQMYLEQQTLKI